MKNRLFSAFALLLLLAVLMCSFACADNIVPVSLGSVAAGTQLNQHLVETEYGHAVFTSGTMPYGTEVVSEEVNGSILHSIKGTPLYAGTYNFDITIKDGDSVIIVLSCSLTVTPAYPMISRCSDISIMPGFSAEISVSAYASDGGYLSYQWYTSDGYPVSGGTSSSVVVSPDRAGNYYYYCAVTNSNNGASTTAYSDYITVSVSAPTVSSISIRSLPAKTEYLVGEQLDTTGLQLAVRYDNGSYDYISYGYEVSSFTFSAAGTQNITVSYSGQTCTFSVYVKDPAKEITSISVSSRPSKTSYTVGEYINTSGLQLIVYSAAGSYTVNSGFTVNPQYLGSEGTQRVTVTYEGKTCYFDVTVESDKETVVIGTMPKLLTYYVGDTLDTTGLVLTVYKGSTRSNVITGFTCSPTRLTTAGVQEITVYYNGATCTFRVTVNNTTPSPTATTGSSNTGVTIGGDGSVITPEPTVTPVIVSTVKPTPEPSNSSGGIKSVVVVILIISIIALAGLCGYAFFAERKRRNKRPGKYRR